MIPSLFRSRKAPPGPDEQIARLRRRMRRMSKRLSKAENALRKAARDAEYHAIAMRKVAPAVAALEARVEDLREQLEPTPRPSTEHGMDEARDLWHAVRREHEQVRVRLTTLTRYEERLRRLEEKTGLPHE